MNSSIRQSVNDASGIDWWDFTGTEMLQLHISGQRWDTATEQHWRTRVEQYITTHPTLDSALIRSLQAFVVKPGMTQEQVLVIWGEPIQRQFMGQGERWAYGPDYPSWGYDLYFENGQLVRIESLTSDPL